MAEAKVKCNELEKFKSARTSENFILIWLDPLRDPDDPETKSFIAYFQELVHLVLLIFDDDRCLDYIIDIEYEKVFLIISEHLAQWFVPILADCPQIDSIYVHCKDRDQHEQWALEQKKIKGVFNQIEPIYDALRRDIRQCEDDLIPFTVTPCDSHWDPSFIHSQLIKEILLDLPYSPDAKFDFAAFCTSVYRGNTYQLDRIQQFAVENERLSSIRCYTSECFVYSILNKAFRLADVNILLKMGFFIRDLHQEIAERHGKSNKFDQLTVYRSQGISEESLTRIIDNRYGFLSFNNFLIASTDKDVAFAYARAARDSHQLTGVLFHIEIDRTKALFTPLDKINYSGESSDEVLFSTHTIFRIIYVKKLEDQLWQINLTLTANEDADLEKLKRYLREKISDKNLHERLHILGVDEWDVLIDEIPEEPLTNPLRTETAV